MASVSEAGDTQVVTKTKWSSYQIYIIFLLMIVYMINFIDRQIIAILSPLIKADLQLTNTELGLLKGLAFAVIYAVASLPIAWLADRKNRVSIISVSIAFWSGMTALCGMAQNFTQLIIARVGVGIGEAGCSPPAHSLISDYFPKESRSSALGIYSLGIPFGTLFGVLFGGWIASNFGWRWAFMLVGLPGILVALIVKLTIKEPIRGVLDQDGKTNVEPQPFQVSMSELFKVKSFVIHCISATMGSFAAFGIALWIVDFLNVVHELPVSEIFKPLSFVMGIGGGIGTLCGGYVTDYFGRKDKSAYFFVPAIVQILSVPLYIGALWIGSPWLSLGIFFFVFMLQNSVAGPYYGLVQLLAPIHLRAFAAAIFFFLLSIIGLALGPLYVGVLADVLEPTMGEAEGLRWALISLGPIWGIASVLLLLNLKTLRRDLGQLKDQS